MPNQSTTTKALPRDNGPTASDYDLLTREEVQRILDINEQTFYRYRRTYPSFKTIRTGRTVKMRRSTLEKFLEDLEERQSA